MKIGAHDIDESVFIIAEIGNNHEGNLDRAKRMVAAGAGAGADAVKFQTLRPEGLVRPQDQTRFATLKRFELSFRDYEALARTARDEGTIFLSTPFDLEACAFLDALLPAFKIASGDNTFYPLLELAASYGKPIILSTGLATLQELQYAVALIERVWSDRRVPSQLALLHCVTSYLTPPAAANLNRIGLLRRIFGLTVGYSDHTLGTTAAVAAVAAGARIVEKHFTLDKNQSAFQDHKLSADPQEMAALVRQIREVEVLFGSGEMGAAECEARNLIAARRSLAVNADLRKGHTVARGDLCWLRPGGGFAPGAEAAVLGRRLTGDVSRGTTLTPEMLE